MLKILPVINNKGGVGKTTTSINLSAGLARRGRRVLLVDLDGQASASRALGVAHSALRPSIAEVLYGEVVPEEAVRATHIDGLDLITGSPELAHADLRLAPLAAREYCLHDVLRSLEARYDVILVDCAPSTSLLSINALVAADAFLIPVSPTFLALQGLVRFSEIVREARHRLGRVAPVLGIVLTQADPAAPGVEEVIRQVRAHYGNQVFDTEIRPDPALAHAPAFGQSIFAFDPDSPGAADYGALAHEVATRIAHYVSLFGSLDRSADALAGSAE